MSAALHLVDPEPLSTQEIVAGEVRAEMARQRRSIKGLSELLGRCYMTAVRKYHGRSEFTSTELVLVANWLDVELTDLMKHPYM